MAPTAGRHGAAPPVRSLLITDGMRRSFVEHITCTFMQCAFYIYFLKKIIIPTCNGCKRLRVRLKSIREQQDVREV